VVNNPAIEWPRVWKNLHTAWLLPVIRSEWYAVIHELLPTNDRLRRIAKLDTDRCGACGLPDSTAHRVMECGNGGAMWRWTQLKIAELLRAGTAAVPDTWPLRPTCDIWPPRRSYAVLWILAHFVYFRTTCKPHLSALDLADFMRRARWKAYQVPRRRRFVDYYLVVL
jgi:hypothetical protein